MTGQLQALTGLVALWVVLAGWTVWAAWVGWWDIALPLGLVQMAPAIHAGWLYDEVAAR